MSIKGISAKVYIKNTLKLVTKSVLKCTYNIVKNINDNDSGDVTPANGDEKRNMLRKNDEH